MASGSRARSRSSAPDAAVIDTAETAAPSRLADRIVLPSCDPGRRRYLWLASDEGRPGFVLDRRWYGARCGGGLAYNTGKTSFSLRQHGSRFAGQLDGRCG